MGGFTELSDKEFLNGNMEKKKNESKEIEEEKKKDEVRNLNDSEEVQGNQAKEIKEEEDRNEETNGGAKIIKMRDYVVLRDIKDNQHIVQVLPGKETRVGQEALRLDTLVGSPYGCTYRYENGEWKRRKRACIESIIDIATPKAVKEDNRNLVDNNKAQCLTNHQIGCMKISLSGEELISEIAKNSATFGNKTAFSQCKYLNKKQKRHITQVTLLDNSMKNVCEAYHKMWPFKTAQLRMDYLSVMLNHADIYEEDSVMIVDQTLGLLTSAVARCINYKGRIYRLAGGLCGGNRIIQETSNGRNLRHLIFDVHLRDLQTEEEKRTQENAADCAKESNQNLNGKQNEKIHTAKSEHIKEKDKEGQGKENEEKNTTIEEEEQSYLQTATEEGREEDEEEQGGEGKNKEDTRDAQQNMKNTERLEEEKKRKEEILNDLNKNGVDSFVGVFSLGKARNACVDTHKRIVTCLHLAHRFLLPQGRLVLYSQNMQPLSECQAMLQKSDEYILVNLREYFLREHQVKPRRTHPFMDSTSYLFSGFILSAIKIS